MQYDGPVLILCVLILCLSYTSYLLLQAIHIIIIIIKSNKIILSLLIILILSIKIIMKIIIIIEKIKKK